MICEIPALQKMSPSFKRCFLINMKFRMDHNYTVKCFSYLTALSLLFTFCDGFVEKHNR